MSRRAVVLLALLITSPVLFYFLWPSDESRIRKIFRSGARAIEQEQTADVMAFVSFSYGDENGLTYLSLRKFLEQVFRNLEEITVDYRIKKLAVQNDKAWVTAEVRLTGRHHQETGSVVGDGAAPKEVRFFLEKVRTTWLVSRTEGIPAGF